MRQHLAIDEHAVAIKDDGADHGRRSAHQIRTKDKGLPRSTTTDYDPTLQDKQFHDRAGLADTVRTALNMGKYRDPARDCAARFLILRRNIARMREPDDEAGERRCLSASSQRGCMRYRSGSIAGTGSISASAAQAAGASKLHGARKYRDKTLSARFHQTKFKGLPPRRQFCLRANQTAGAFAKPAQRRPLRPAEAAYTSCSAGALRALSMDVGAKTISQTTSALSCPGTSAISATGSDA